MTNPFESLTSVFHEPNRMAIMSALAGSQNGKSFSELKRECDLTDGNLSRHIAALEKGGMVRVDKSFVESRPRTTISVSGAGRRAFLRYLEDLEEALRIANKKSVPRDERHAPPLAKAVKA